MKNTKIVLALIERGLHQTDLREMAGFRSEARLSRIINGREKPTTQEIEKICKVLGKSAECLNLNVRDNNESLLETNK